jgi:hypothetical protein
MPARVPAKSGSADHANRRRNDDPAGLNHHDIAPVEVASAVAAAMGVTAATFRGLGTEACEAQQGGECRYRKDLSGHLFLPWFSVKT